MTPGSAAPLLAVFDYAGAALFGLAAAAGLGRRDVFSAASLALAAGLAGPLLRDLVLGAPLAFLVDPVLPAFALIAAGGAYVLRGRLAGAALRAVEAAGGAVVAAAAAAKAALWGAPPLGTAALGVLAGLAGAASLRALNRAPQEIPAPPEEPPRPFEGQTVPAAADGGEIFAASAVSAVVFVLLRLLQAGPGVSLGLAAGGGLLAALALGGRRGP